MLMGATRSTLPLRLIRTLLSVRGHLMDYRSSIAKGTHPPSELIFTAQSQMGVVNSRLQISLERQAIHNGGLRLFLFHLRKLLSQRIQGRLRNCRFMRRGRVRASWRWIGWTA